MMRYKGYICQIEFDSDAKIFHGEVLGLKDIITFQGTTVKDLEQAFRDSVEDYISWCKERGEKPEKTYSGQMRININPDLHAYLALEAARQNISLNTLINEKLRR